VNALVLSAGLVTLAVLMTVIVLRWRRGRGIDLGTVSTQWVVEHRMGPGHEANRWNQR